MKLIATVFAIFITAWPALADSAPQTTSNRKWLYQQHNDWLSKEAARKKAASSLERIGSSPKSPARAGF